MALRSSPITSASFVRRRRSLLGPHHHFDVQLQFVVRHTHRAFAKKTKSQPHKASNQTALLEKQAQKTNPTSASEVSNDSSLKLPFGTRAWIAVKRVGTYPVRFARYVDRITFGSNDTLYEHAPNMIPASAATQQQQQYDRTKQWVATWLTGSYYWYYSKQHVRAMATRAILAIAVIGSAHWCFPIDMPVIQGPSMIPTIAPDRTNVWLALWIPQFARSWLVPCLVKKHSIISFEGHDTLSVKRVVGLAGDEVKRYGEYANRFTANYNYGMPHYDYEGMRSMRRYQWIDFEFQWDKDPEKKKPFLEQNINRTLIVPDGHLWLEGDNCQFSNDSRLHGPIPYTMVYSVYLYRVWPVLTRVWWLNWRTRPDPKCPASTAFLAKYNVHVVKKENPDENDSEIKHPKA
jgi:signal peptidase I